MKIVYNALNVRASRLTLKRTNTLRESAYLITYTEFLILSGNQRKFFLSIYLNIFMV